jgi:hypothetical protein
MKKITFVLCLTFLASFIFAQNDLLIPRNLLSNYENGYRSLNGAPGENYWQNHADYQINVELLPETRTVKGNETILYYNESPDTLKEIVLALYQNVLNKDAKRARPLPRNILNDNTVNIEKLMIAGEKVDMKKQVKKTSTNIVVTLNKPVLPGGKVEIEASWNYQMVKGLQLRTGDYGNGVVFVGYFYPKVAVYDDVDGWDKMDYNVLHEFYSDFNSYDVKITAPSDYIVSATGRLQNSKDILSPKFDKRYQKALNSKEVVHIVDSLDVANGRITKKGDRHTWHYIAPLAPDFAFSTCKDALWDGSMVQLKSKKVFVDAVYLKTSWDFFKVAEVAAAAVECLSEVFPGVDYPYTDMTIINAGAAMEFPMMVNDPSVSRVESLHSLTTHEVAHTYFPFYIGTNERKYAWMDEAWANIAPIFYFESKQMKNGYIPYKLERYYRIAGTQQELPIMTLTNYLEYYPAYRHATYSKPSYGLLFLRDLLGEELFGERLKLYFKNWGFKHPIPYDFFSAFNPDNDPTVNWFYKKFYFETCYADLSLVNKDDQFKVVNKGGMPLAFEVIYQLEDGEEKTMTYPATIWMNTTEVSIPSMKNVTKMEVKNQWNLDVNKEDNVIN